MVTVKELQRIFHSRVTQIAAGVLVIYYIVIAAFINRENCDNMRERDSKINAYLSSLDGLDESKMCDHIREELEELRNVVFEEPEKAVSTAGKYADNLMGDMSIVLNAEKAAAFIFEEYPALMKQTINKSLEYLREASSTYTRREQQKVISQYNRVRDFKLKGTSGAEVFIQLQDNFGYFNVLWLLVVLVTAAERFAEEYELRSGGMVFAAPNGRSKLFLSKLSAVMIVTAGIEMCLFLADLFTGMYTMGADMLSEPIQAVGFKGCPLKINVLGFFALKHALLLLLCFALISLCALVCTFVKRGFAAMMISALPTGAGIAVLFDLQHTIFDSINAVALAKYDNLRQWLPVCLIAPNDYLKKFDCVNVFGIPVERLIICAALTLIFTITGATAAALRYGRARRFGG